MTQKKDVMRESLLKEALKFASRTYGIIHKATPAFMNNYNGFLIWDFQVYNELTFFNSETKDFISLYHSVLDEKMESMFYEFAEKYGIEENTFNQALLKHS